MRIPALGSLPNLRAAPRSNGEVTTGSGATGGSVSTAIGGRSPEVWLQLKLGPANNIVSI